MWSFINNRHYRLHWRRTARNLSGPPAIRHVEIPLRKGKPVPCHLAILLSLAPKVLVVFYSTHTGCISPVVSLVHLRHRRNLSLYVFGWCDGWVCNNRHRGTFGLFITAWSIEPKCFCNRPHWGFLFAFLSSSSTTPTCFRKRNSLRTLQLPCEGGCVLGLKLRGCVKSFILCNYIMALCLHCAFFVLVRWVSLWISAVWCRLRRSAQLSLPLHRCKKSHWATKIWKLIVLQDNSWCVR